VRGAVYATAGYKQQVTNLSGLSLATDGIFRDGYETQLAAMTGSTSGGYTSTLTVPIGRRRWKGSGPDPSLDGNAYRATAPGTHAKGRARQARSPVRP